MQYEIFKKKECKSIRRTSYVTYLLKHESPAEVAGDLCLRIQEPDLAAVVVGPDGEVEPIGPLRLALYEELVEVALHIVGDVDQDAGIADGLLGAQTTDIYRTASQVVAGGRRFVTRPNHFLHHLH